MERDCFQLRKTYHRSKNEAYIGRRMDRYMERAPSLVVIADFDVSNDHVPQEDFDKAVTGQEIWMCKRPVG